MPDLIATVDDVVVGTRRMSHRWGRPFGASHALVNGVRKRIPLICTQCFTRDDAPASDQWCRPFGTAP